MKARLICILLILIISSCSKRNLIYLSTDQGPAIQTERIENNRTKDSDPKIQPDDLLSISVTSLSPEANVLFNRGEVVSVGNGGGYIPSTSGGMNEGYLVDSEGYVDFPVLGRIKVAGLTKSEAKAGLHAQLIRYLKEPVVNIRFMNFRVTVVGEVNHPSTFTIPSEKITILEALGMAGDMTPFGKREDVLLIREEEGATTLTRLNLNSKEILHSPYFYLQQNDVVYVEPTKAKAAQASTSRSDISIVLSAVSILTFIVTAFL